MTRGHRDLSTRLFRLVRASNTGRILGFRLGRLWVVNGSQGWVDWYRNGYVVHFGKRKLGFIPTTRYHAPAAWRRS